MFIIWLVDFFKGLRRVPSRPTSQVKKGIEYVNVHFIGTYESINPKLWP